MDTRRRKVITIDVGIRNLAIGVLEYTYTETPPYPWENLSILSWELIDVFREGGIHVKNVKTVNIHRVCTKVFECLFARRALFEGATDVLVEQQPIRGVTGSARLKVVQHAIMGFFETYYMFHPNIRKANIVATPPGKKLCCGFDTQDFGKTGDPPKVPRKSKQSETHSELLSSEDSESHDEEEKKKNEKEKQKKKTSNYRNRKKQAVEMMCNVVFPLAKVPEELRNVIVDAKKKDDLADCILQAVYYLQSNIPKKQSNKVSALKRASKRIRLE